jgi:hypothetical protein
VVAQILTINEKTVLQLIDRCCRTVETREIETIIEKEVNILYWWHKLQIWIGRIALTIGAGWIIGRLATRHL